MSDITQFVHFIFVAFIIISIQKMKKVMLILAIVFSGMLMQAQADQFSEKFDYADFWDDEAEVWGLNAHFDQNIVIIFNYKNPSDVYVNSRTPYTLYAVDKVEAINDEEYAMHFIDNKGETGEYSWWPRLGIFAVFYNNGMKIRYIISDRFNENK